MIISSRARRSMICEIRSKPFWAAKRETMPITGSFGIGICDSEGGQQILLALWPCRKDPAAKISRLMNLSVCGTPLVVVDAIQNASHG